MGKSQFPATLNWQSTSPVTGFLPGPGPNQSVAGNSLPSGTVSGTMSSTNTIYTNIIGTAQGDNIGIEVNFTGTPTGTYSVMVSNSGAHFYALTFNPSIVQPSGSAGGFVIALRDFPFRYLFLQYTNSTGSGSTTAYFQSKANNS